MYIIHNFFKILSCQQVISVNIIYEILYFPIYTKHLFNVRFPLTTHLNVD